MALRAPRADALIEDEGGLRQFGRHPLAQVLDDWATRAVIVGERVRLDLNQSDLLLARELLNQYEQRLGEQQVETLDMALLRRRRPDSRG